MNDFELREAEAQDIQFIYATWLNSYRYDGFASKGVRNSVFFPEYNKIIDSILAKPDTRVLLAHVKGEPDVLLAYLVYENNMIHYCFCKEAFRGFGIASALYKEAFPDPTIEITCTCKTRHSIPVMNHMSNLTYNPFVLYQT